MRIRAMDGAGVRAEQKKFCPFLIPVETMSGFCVEEKCMMWRPFFSGGGEPEHDCALARAAKDGGDNA